MGRTLIHDAPEPKGVSRGEARRARFLEAASEVFLRHGYGAANVNEIIRRAGGSLATLYQQFESKEKLFLAVLQSGVEDIIAPIDAALDEAQPLEAGLVKVGVAYLETVLTPTGIAVYRIILAEGRRYPDLVRRFHDEGPDRIAAALEGFLRARAAAGEGQTADPAFAATAFLSMVAGRHRARALADPDFALAPGEIERHVTACVRVFLAGAFAP